MSTATKLSDIEQLRRVTLATFLWDSNFTVDGTDVQSSMGALIQKCSTEDVAALAIEAREQMHLRSIPLMLVRELARRPKVGSILSQTLTRIIQRPDEIHKFLALYWKDGKCPLSAQVKKGLAGAFQKFNAYGFAKYRSGENVALRDAMFLTHPTPKASSGKQTKFERREGVQHELTQDERLFKQIAEDTLPTPDTWEVALSGGADKKETFERLLMDGKLGYMALLRNLRNMAQANVRDDLVGEALLARRGADQVLPFRYFTAAKHAPKYQMWLEEALIEQMKTFPKLKGRTLVVVDVSGSMGANISGNSEVTRAIAASSLAAIAREICEESVIYATAGSDSARKHKTALVPESRGMTLAKEIWDMCYPLGGGGIFLNQVIRYLQKEENIGQFQRVIILTDESDMGYGNDTAENAPLMAPYNYIMNVAGYRNGIGYGKWTKITGFSENVLKYIAEVEAADERSNNQAA